MGSCLTDESQRAATLRGQDPRTRTALLPWSAVIAAFVLLAVAAIGAGLGQRTGGAIDSNGWATFTATEDTYVKDNPPTSNYGQRSTLEADNAPSVKRALLRFDVSGIPDGATITSATLSLYTLNGSAQAGAAYAVVGSWSEATTTWSDAPPVGDKVADLASPAVVDTWTQANVTAAVTGNGLLDFYIVTPSSDSVSYSSSEAASNHPALFLEWFDPNSTPMPTSTPTSTSTVTPTPTSTPTHTPTPTATPIPEGMDVLTFSPTDDAYVHAGQPTTNFGSATSLQIDGSPQKDFLIKFSVSGLNGRQPNSAKLRLYNVNASSKGGDFRRMAQTAWSEATVIWNDAPPGDPVPTASLGVVSPNNWYEVDITSLVTGDGIVSLRVTSTWWDGADYSSKEGAAQFRPQLVVTVPIDPDAPTSTPTATPTATPTPGGDPVFVGAGDIASCSGSGDDATADLLDAIPGTVYTTGDNAQGDGSPDEYTDCYGRSWGRHKARTRPSAGNHDYDQPGALPYYDYFGSAAAGPYTCTDTRFTPAVTGPCGYYSYDLGAWHIIVLNANCDAVGGCAAGSPQEQWLRADLAAHPAACTLAIWHQPRFSSGSIGGTSLVKPFWEALYDYGAEVVLNGHAHDYERFAPQDPSGNLDTANGIVEFVVGTGGSFHTGTGSLKPNSQVFNNDTFGVLKLTLRPTSYDWEFIPEAGKTFTDSGSAACH